MATDPEYGTPAWYNAIAERAVKRIVALAEPSIRRSLQGGYAGGFSPMIIGTLKKMPVQQAIGFLTNMMQVPATRASGVSLFAQYLGWLESTGQLAPGAGKMIAAQAARAQVSGEVR